MSALVTREGALPYAPRKFWDKLLKETDLGMIRALFDP